MNYQSKKTRRTAFVLLFIFGYNLAAPEIAFALTSGPSQPEVKGFQPAGVSDMVDLQTGDFKYNIPLLDIDGYPINLAYQSGAGIDDEASWVGLGWSLNVGSINRQVRGIPDDMKGDLIQTDHYTKPKITVGGRIRAKVELGGQYLEPLTATTSIVKGGGAVKGEGSLSLGVFSDNYTGIGAEVGVNAGISLSGGNDGSLTAGLGLGILSSTSSGVDISPYANLSLKNETDTKMTTISGLSANLGYNTRSGMKALALNCSYGLNSVPNLWELGGSVITFNTEPISPKIQIPYKSNFASFSLDIGPAAFSAFLGAGGTGYRSIREVLSKVNTNPAYGTLYAEQGKNVKNAVMDFIREKDNPIIPELPNLALPVNTSDMFSYTSQFGSGQFRLFRGGTGAFFDNEVSDQNTSNTAGIDIGIGAYGHFGTTFYNQKSTNTTRKWTAENPYLNSGDFQDIDFANPLNQQVYFKQIGEKTLPDADLASQLHGTEALAVRIDGSATTNSFSTYAGTSLSRIIKRKREPEQTSISYLTAKEAALYGLDKSIVSYKANDLATFQPQAGHKLTVVSSIPRVSGNRAAHHFSEITVTDGQGKKMIYGVPVYQNKQYEYSFAVGSRTVSPFISGTTDQVAAPAEAQMGQNAGIDNYYHRDAQPAYASSFLLSAILSPDYVDRTGDGVTNDDLGTAIRFNYSMTAPKYQWRTPYKNATLNKGLQADADDDKASIIYGEKELWYISSIESKTKIAYFITENRDDALGVTAVTGGQNTAVRQKRLREIRLYAKTDLTRPIKVVKLNYDYSLCPNAPNSVATAGGTHGKLTLKDVHFEYANTTKGQYFPYKFNYNTDYVNLAGATIANVPYATASTDRWGIYRPGSDIVPFALRNDEFPYARQETTGVKTQITTSAGSAAALWQLNHIDLPTGGGIDVGYESDDYAYVQDKKAMVMTKVEDLVKSDNTSAGSNDLLHTEGIKIRVAATADNPNATDWFKKTYLNGSDYIYSKFSVKVSTPNSDSKGQDYDFIPSYSEVLSVRVANNYAFIQLKDRSDGGITRNPIIFSAWQRMKEEYPRFAYPGFDRRIGNESASSSFSKAIQAIFSAFANLSELQESFYHKAERLLYANTVQLNKSFVRVTKTDGFKLGGGARVKKIMINDDWNDMGGSSTTKKYYGQAYDYTTTEDNQVISSGVASYEPGVGNDENPLKQPVFYVEKVKGALDNFFSLEEPFGESFFPAPSVVYSKVTVTDLDATQNPDPNLQTGYVVNEFYTAKDFPVKVTVLPIQRFDPRPQPKYSLVSSSSIDKMVLSQGYAIDVNDMHGKPKAVRIFNQSRMEIASTVYNYNAGRDASGAMRLKNTVSIVNRDGSVSQNQVIGRDVEFFTDMREQEAVNNGVSINVGSDLIPAFGIPFPIPHWPSSGNSDYKLFRSACAVKVSQYYGLVQSVVKTTNGSSIITENIAYDGQTGDPIVTRTQNEFNKDLFSISIPAYWAYAGMGPASQRQGVLTSLKTDAIGIIDNNFLQVGDKFVDLNSTDEKAYWVVLQQITDPYFSGREKLVIDKYGQVQPGLNLAKVKIVSSGDKNLLTSGLTSLVCLNNPIVANTGGPGFRLALGSSDLTALKVINASAKTYSENWSGEMPDIHAYTASTNYDFTLVPGGGYGELSKTYYMSNMGANHTYTSDDRASGELINSHYFDKAIHFRSGLIDNLQALIAPSNNNNFGAYSTFYAPRTGTYYVGFDSGVKMSFAFDCSTTWTSFGSHNDASHPGFNIIPVEFTQGNHVIRVQMSYFGLIPAGVDVDNAAGGIEIYDNTLADIRNTATSNGDAIHTIWSTANLYGSNSIVYINNGTTTTYSAKYSDGPGTAYTPCTVPVKSINPYTYGFLGNWRPYENLVYQQSRVYANILNSGTAKVDVKNSGYINNFYSYWFLSSDTYTWRANTGVMKWVTGNTVTQYDKYGQETENRDALGRYSAAAFDFGGTLPSAVASNAMAREIYVNSFEDNQYESVQKVFLDAQVQREFTDPNTGRGINSLIQKGDAHTGNYCALLPANGVKMSTIVYNSSPDISTDLLDVDVSHQFTKSGRYGLYPIGFEPGFGAGKLYLVDVWVKDGLPFDRSVKLSMTVNGLAQTFTCKAVVEGWKLLEGKIDLSAIVSSPTALDIALIPVSGATVYIDDLRIHPYNAQMKTYAYDDATMRLMAELDENGFASFYEYDSEGLLVRVKKETERGIMTIKENRSSQRKRSL